MNKKNTVISLSNIGKKYIIAYQKSSLINSLINKNKTKEFWAVKNINLNIKKGERIGIIGPNGAGKTTLLKIIAGITKSTTGIVKTNGKIVSLINLEAGFHPELSGIENIYINGMLIGMSRTEINNKKKQIIDFANIGNFINAPFYTYSNGMKFRLAFSIAIISKCDILIMDEIFMAGDLNFQFKALNMIKSIQKEKSITTILCSHAPWMSWGFSERAFIMNKGHIKKISKNKIFKMLKIKDIRWQKLFSINRNLSNEFNYY